MTDEDRLREALEADAATHDVDLLGLYAATRARLGEQEALEARRSRSGTTSRVLLAAAAVVVVAGVGFLVPHVTDRLLSDDYTSSSGAVDDDFTCPIQQTTDFASDDDDSFLPELSAEAKPTGEAAGAPRHEVAVDGDRATLRLGNDDGTLASVTTFDRVGESYRRVAVTKCSNDPVAGSSSAALVTEGLPRTSSDLRAQDVAPGASLVADRLTYDVAGLAKRISMYAYPCQPRVCVEAGSRTDTRTRSSLPRSGAPVDVTSQLADPDDVVGVDSAQLLVALYDADDEVVEVSWSDTAGAVTVVPAVADGEWRGQVFLVLVPTDSFASLTVTRSEGRSSEYSAVDLRD
ncbi:hypothetical protein BH09ACT12_BH09ACT12_34860 [soil metagenome]